MSSNIVGSPRTTIVGVLVFVAGGVSALGNYAAILPPKVAMVIGVASAFVALGLGLFGVDPSKLQGGAKGPGALPPPPPSGGGFA